MSAPMSALISAPRSTPLPRTAVRVAGALGLAHVLVVLAGFAITGPSKDTVLGAPMADTVRFYTEAPSSRLFTGGYVEMLGYLLFLPFLVCLYRYLRGGEPRTGIAAATGLLGGLAYLAAVLAGGFAAGGAAVYAGHSGASGDAVYALSLLRSFGYFVALAAWAVFFAGVGLSGLSGRTLPRWLTGTALVLAIALIAGVAGAADGWADLPGFLGLGWVLAASIFLLGPGGGGTGGRDRRTDPSLNRALRRAGPWPS